LEINAACGVHQEKLLNKEVIIIKALKRSFGAVIEVEFCSTMSTEALNGN